MKKFFSNPYIIAWICVFVVFIVVISLSFLADILINISIFLLGGECIYTGVLLLLYQKHKNKIDITEFMNEDEKEKKKVAFYQKEGKTNMMIFVMSLFVIGAILVYLAFRSI